MALEVGTRLGQYEVTALIGEGGMGQVYQATDTKLNRQVALKILPEAFATDPDRLARFQREAQVLASLNHPNIGQIHGIEDSEGTKALVLELVEGPTLADRIAQGPIPVDEALPIAKQIAEALEAAHEQGVIHRDLKPANIKLRPDGTVKVLDFGLAKALDTTPEGDPSQSPTLTAAATQMGVIMGTAAYMSPEQARGRPVDRRSDIWAFGAVLYEMLAGRRAFEGEDVSLTLSEVMKSDPELASLSPEVTPSLRIVLSRCLMKDPRQRFADMQDVRLAMGGAFDTEIDAPSSFEDNPRFYFWQRPVPSSVVVVGTAFLVGSFVWSLRSPSLPAPAPVMNLSILPPAGVRPTGRVAISPEGGTVAFAGISQGDTHVYLRAMERREAVPLPGGEGASPIAFSPDGEWLLVADSQVDGNTQLTGEVKRVPLSGGAVTAIAAGPGGAAWTSDDSIIVGRVGGGLERISSSGSDPAVLTTLGDGEVGHVVPSLLPGDRAVLFQTWTGSPASDQVAVYDFETSEQNALLRGSTPRFIEPGYLIFWRDGALWAVPFDVDRLEVSGQPAVVVEDVAAFSTAYVGAYSVAANGTLVYMPSEASGSTMGWVSREGEMTRSVLQGLSLAMPRLSPDGTRVAFRRGQVDGDALWIRDLDSGRETRLTDTSGGDMLPTWTPDGSVIAFGRSLDGSFQLHARAADLSGQTELLARTHEASLPGSWTPDGKALVYYTLETGVNRDIWTAPVGGDPVPFLATDFNERAPRLSPNGEWLAYVSDQNGSDQVFVQAFPEGGRVFPVSTGPGGEAVWSRDGRELFYRNGTELWVADVEMEPGFRAGPPRLLFSAAFDTDVSGAGSPSYDVSLDGQEFLMVRRTLRTEAPGFNLVQNWTKELERLVPLD